jgi:hypothetical protein
MKIASWLRYGMALTAGFVFVFVLSPVWYVVPAWYVEQTRPWYEEQARLWSEAQARQARQAQQARQAVDEGYARCLAASAVGDSPIGTLVAEGYVRPDCTDWVELIGRYEEGQKGKQEETAEPRARTAQRGQEGKQE